MMPGISPRSARFRKHKRQSLNFLRKPRARPQIWQRLRARILYFGVFFDFAILAVVAMNPLFPERHSEVLQQRQRFRI